MTDIVWRLKTAASHADAGPATCRVLITEALEAAEEIERLSDEVREWREMDDQIRNFVGGERDGRNTLEIVKEKFTAKWDAEDHSYRLLLDSYTHPIIELLQAENDRLRAALGGVLKAGVYNDACECMSCEMARAALGGESND